MPYGEAPPFGSGVQQQPQYAGPPYNAPPYNGPPPAGFAPPYNAGGGFQPGYAPPQGPIMQQPGQPGMAPGQMPPPGPPGKCTMCYCYYIFKLKIKNCVLLNGNKFI